MIAIGIEVSVGAGLLFLLLKNILHSKWMLHTQCEKGEIEGVKWHLDEGADLNASYNKGVTLLHTTAAYDHKELVELCL